MTMLCRRRRKSSRRRCRMRRRSSSRRRRRIDRPMGDGIMYASAAGHIRRLVSRHHKTPNLSAGHSYFHQICIFCQEFDQLLLTCESLAAASLAWMMNPLNLDIIVVGMMKVTMKRRSSYQKTKERSPAILAYSHFQNDTNTQTQKSKQDDLPSWPAASSMPSISPG